jgi:hypothetical protein
MLSFSRPVCYLVVAVETFDPFARDGFWEVLCIYR